MVVQIDPLTNAVVDQLDLRGIVLAGHRNGVWVATVTVLMVRIDIRGGKGVIAKSTPTRARQGDRRTRCGRKRPMGACARRAAE